MTLMACLPLSLSLLFAQSSNARQALVPNESVELQSPSLPASDISGADVTATNPDAPAPDASNSQTNKTGNGGSTPGCTQPCGTSSGPAAAGTYVFPTSGEMNRYWMKNTLGPKAWVGAAFTASWKQWVSDSPSEWSKDFTGWSQRFGVSLLDNGINTTTLVWVSRAMNQDPRYRRCDCTGFWPRTRHAIVLSVMAYNRNGDLVFSPAKVGSPFTGPMVTRPTLYPDRFGISNAFTGGGGAYYLAGSVGWNWVREFILKK
jgi:hypothetical protein